MHQQPRASAQRDLGLGQQEFCERLDLRPIEREIASPHCETEHQQEIGPGADGDATEPEAAEEERGGIEARDRAGQASNETDAAEVTVPNCRIGGRLDRISARNPPALITVANRMKALNGRAAGPAAGTPLNRDDAAGPGAAPCTSEPMIEATIRE